MTEPELLEHIKRIEVKGKNVAVHRQEFYAITQAPGQTIQQFVAKLKAKAAGGQRDYQVLGPVSFFWSL